MLQNTASILGSERNESFPAEQISKSQAWLFFSSLASQSIFDQIKEKAKLSKKKNELITNQQHDQ